MATATEYTSPPPFSRSSSLSITRSPDTASSLYPERAIRPLPRSRLKAKLSPEHAASIVYPPEPAPVSPIDAVTNGYNVHPDNHHVHSHHVTRADDSRFEGRCTCGEDRDSGDEEVEFDHPNFRYAHPFPSGPNGAGGDEVLDNVQRRLMEAAHISGGPDSATSSVDGYESFENMSNKKKRKIPAAVGSSMHQSQLSAEMASMGIRASHDGANDDLDAGATAVHRQLPALAGDGANGAGTGISGAGRGRYGRQNGRGDHVGRRPLGASAGNSIPGYARALAKAGELKTSDVGIENAGGIISQAIKSAAEQGPWTPDKNSQSASLLHSAASNASTPVNARTQFTFTVESESGNKMLDQQQAVPGAPLTTPPRNMPPAPAPPVGAGHKGTSTTQGTQTTPSLRPPMNNANQPRQAPPPPPAPAPAPKPRRRNPAKEYALAARQRRLQQQYTNYHHRPTKDSMWICEFCEYEDIFGVPPSALIRQYEVKDRQERKRLAEKRRLLEKAKAKGRKGKKKGSKNKGDANAAQTAAAGGAPYDPNAPGTPLDGLDYPYDQAQYDDDEYDPVDEGADYEPYVPPPPSGTPKVGTSGTVGNGGGGGGGRRAG